jgi:hypothetical protein
MEFMEYAWFLDPNQYVMASAHHFGRVMRCQDNLKDNVVTRQRGAE